MAQDSSCSICGNTSEDILHVLRACTTAKEIWTLVVPMHQQTRFFSDPFHSWFSTNLSNPLDLQVHGIPWASLFGLIAWRIWKNRNLLIFQKVSWAASDIVKVSVNWAQQFESSKSFYKSNPKAPSFTNYSKGQWVHLFIGGVVESFMGNASTDGVIRDQTGNWIWATIDTWASVLPSKRNFEAY